MKLPVYIVSGYGESDGHECYFYPLGDGKRGVKAYPEGDPESGLERVMTIYDRQVEGYELGVAPAVLGLCIVVHVRKDGDFEWCYGYVTELATPLTETYYTTEEASEDTPLHPDVDDLIDALDQWPGAIDDFRDANVGIMNEGEEDERLVLIDWGMGETPLTNRDCWYTKEDADKRGVVIDMEQGVKV